MSKACDLAYVSEQDDDQAPRENDADEDCPSPAKVAFNLDVLVCSSGVEHSSVRRSHAAARGSSV